MRTRPSASVVICSTRALRSASDCGDRADELGRDVDRDALVRLLDLAVDLMEQHLRARHLELEALAAHLLDEHGQLELATAAHLERLGRGGGQHLDRHVAEHLALEALP